MNPIAFISIAILISAMSLILGFRFGRQSSGFPRSTWNDLASIPPVVIDGGTFVLIGGLNAVASGLGNDEAAKYVAPQTLFWVRLGCSMFLQSLLALKMYRSTGFAKAQLEKAEDKRRETGTMTKQEVNMADVKHL